jgi:hypothetical protein
VAINLNMLTSLNLKVVIMVVRNRRAWQTMLVPQQNIGFCYGYQMDMNVLPIGTTCYDLITPNWISHMEGGWHSVCQCEWLWKANLPTNLSPSWNQHYICSLRFLRLNS